MVNDNLKMHANGCGIPEKSWHFFLLSDGFALTCKSKLIAKKTCLQKLRINVKLESWLLKHHGVSCSQVLVSPSYKISSREVLKHALGYFIF